MYVCMYVFIYLFDRERAGTGGKAEGKGEVGLALSRELMQGSIPGPRDYDLSSRQMLHQLSHPSTSVFIFCGCYNKAINFIA